MKKILLSLLTAILCLCTIEAQEIQYYLALNNNGATSNVRAPQGGVRYLRSVYLITPAEMAASGLVSGDVITAIAFQISVAQNIPTAGTLDVYLRNTSDTTATALSSNDWATLIAPMTLVSSAAATIPATTGRIDFPFSGGSPFTYTGGGVYVAIDWQFPVGTLSTLNTHFCNNLTANMIRSANNNGSPPATLGSMASFRPQTWFGKNVPCATLPNLAFTAYSDTSAQITWTGSANQEIEWGVFPYAQGGGGSTASVSSATSHTLTGLIPGTSYDVYVRKECSPGVYSIWDKVTVGTSLTSPVTSYPYSMNFEPSPSQAYLFNLGWANQPTGNVGTWQWFNAASFANSGTFLIGSAFSNTVASNAWIFSRPFAMTAGNTYTINFSYRTFNSANPPLNFAIGVNTTNSGTGATILQSYNSVNSNSYINTSVTFTPTTTGNYHIGFQNNTPVTTGSTNFILIDDVIVTETLSVDELEKSSHLLSIFPNPARERFQIKISDEYDTSKVTLKLTDLNGRLVKTFNYADSYDVTDIAKGVYILTVSDGTQSETRKFIKN